MGTSYYKSFLYKTTLYLENVLTSLVGWLRTISTESTLRWFVETSTTVNEMLTDQTIELTQGDNLRYKHKVKSVPEGVTIVKAWFTAKKVLTTDTPTPGTPVPDNDALFQKIITPVLSADGQITNESKKASMYFDLVAAESIDYDVDVYEFDIQILSSTGAVFTDVRGTITILQGVTLDYNL